MIDIRNPSGGDPTWLEAVNHQLRTLSAGYTLNPPTVVAVGTTSAQVVAANPARRFLAIMVNGAADVAVSTGPAASLATGIPLMAHASGATYPGGYWESSHNGAVQAIGRAASSVIVLEGF